jgi:hypothetical protein
MFLNCSKPGCQTACKPGSVPPLELTPGRGWPFLWDARYRAPRATDPSGGAKVRPAFPRTGCLPLLLGLAPGGVFPAAAVAGGAVRSYRTVSPLPPAGHSGRTGGVLSVALSLGSPPPGVTRHRTSVEPGLSSLRPTAESGHPAVWLRRFGYRPGRCQRPRAKPCVPCCGGSHEKHVAVRAPAPRVMNSRSG